MAKIGIIGWGVVGKATGKGFLNNFENKVFWHDKHLKGGSSLAKVIRESEFIFLCLPTPMTANYSSIDLSILDQMVDEIAPKIRSTNKVLIVKSSVVPGTTDRYYQKYPKVNFAMNPEFLTEINADWDFIDTDRVVIGAYSEDVASRIAKLYRRLLGRDVPIYLTDPKTAELVKYMANTYLATKIIFANEYKALADKLGINYDDVKKMVAADKRIEESFLAVSPFGGFGLKCFPKDMVAILGRARELGVDMSLLKAAWKKNLKLRKVRDWEEIDGAVSKPKK